jgi:hypothetical protein
MQEHQFDNSFYRAILDAMPLPVFIVDDDVRIIDLNRMAALVFSLEKPAVFRQRGGAALHCLHSTDSPGGCGRGPFCRSCVIRNAVGESMKGMSVVRRRTRVELRLQGNTRQLDLLVTASPLPGPVERLSLLIVEDISELAKLHELIPICANCKCVRRDEEYWMSVESYFTEETGADFSHSICPDCRKQLYPELARVRPTPAEDPQPSSVV